VASQYPQGATSNQSPCNASPTGNCRWRSPRCDGRRFGASFGAKTGARFGAKTGARFGASFRPLRLGLPPPRLPPRAPARAASAVLEASSRLGPPAARQSRVTGRGQQRAFVSCGLTGWVPVLCCRSRSSKRVSTPRTEDIAGNREPLATTFRPRDDPRIFQVRIQRRKSKA
jgi:hypothetical protein